MSKEKGIEVLIEFGSGLRSTKAYYKDEKLFAKIFDQYFELTPDGFATELHSILGSKGRKWYDAKIFPKEILEQK